MLESQRKENKMPELKVKVTAHESFIVIEPLQLEGDENLIPPGNGKIGTVLIDTKKYLGMSKKAVKTLKKLKKSYDDIGDISTWKSADGKHCFGWIGSMYGLFDMNTAEGDSNGIIDIDHVEIPNEIPEKAMQAIKKRKEGKNE